MNKSDLIMKMAERSKISTQQAEQVIEAIIRKMRDALAGGGRVEIRGLFSLKVKSYPERQGRNPKTGEPRFVAASKRPVFKPGRELEERINETFRSRRS